MTKQEIINYMYENHVQGDFKIEEMAEDLAHPEIIRCKYCKHWCLSSCPCVFVDGDFKWINFMEDDGWCSKGELRGDTNADDRC